MILAKYDSSHIAMKVDIENMFGLKPSQIEEQLDENRINGKVVTLLHTVTNNSILDCRQELFNFIKTSIKKKVKVGLQVGLY